MGLIDTYHAEYEYLYESILTHENRKENMMEASKLWRAVVIDVSKDYRDVELQHVLVDNCSFQIVVAPRQFDVMVAGNMFGDILSDELGALAGFDRTRTGVGHGSCHSIPCNRSKGDLHRFGSSSIPDEHHSDGDGDPMDDIVKMGSGLLGGLFKK